MNLSFACTQLNLILKLCNTIKFIPKRLLKILQNSFMHTLVGLICLLSVFSLTMSNRFNVLNGELGICSTDPLTGFFFQSILKNNCKF